MGLTIMKFFATQNYFTFTKELIAFTKELITFTKILSWELCPHAINPAPNKVS